MSGGKRWGARRDANELEIVNALRAQGVSVYRIESTRDPGVFDLLCEVCDRRLMRWRELAADIWLRLDGVRSPGEISRAMDDLDELIAMMREEPSHWVLLEVKDMSSDRGGSKGRLPARGLAPGGKYEDVLDHCAPDVARKLRKDQADFLLRHHAPRYVVTSIAEAFRACGLDPCTACDGTGRAPHLYEKGADAPCPRCEDCSGLEPQDRPRAAK